MDEQEASFGESERFQQQQHLFSSQSDIQVGEVIADEQRDLVRERWRVLADFDFGCAKSSRPIGSKVAADVAIKVEQQRFVRRLCRVFSHSKSTGSPSNAMLAAT